MGCGYTQEVPSVGHVWWSVGCLLGYRAFRVVGQPRAQGKNITGPAAVVLSPRSPAWPAGPQHLQFPLSEATRLYHIQSSFSS